MKLFSFFIAGYQQGEVGIKNRPLFRKAFGLPDNTHLICVLPKHFLYDCLGGVWGLLPVVFLI